jgi:hypothetical protein|tara:strand:- start:6246 stop:6557 length:312 start_codon:yes stop_codon:yes gene_type:complete
VRVQCVRRDFQSFTQIPQAPHGVFIKANAVLTESVNTHASKDQRCPSSRILDVFVSLPDRHLIPQFFLRPSKVLAGFHEYRLSVFGGRQVCIDDGSMAYLFFE